MSTRQPSPAYPGYKAAQCNGCGLCCLAVPCVISLQFDLWRNGRCRALRFAAGRYFCDVIVDPRRVSTRLSRIPRAQRINAIGTGHGCDHRAAWSIDEALQLLAERNLFDEITGNPGDTYPRGVILHAPDGRKWNVVRESADDEPTVSEVRPDLGYPDLIPLSEWRRQHLPAGR